VTTKHQLATTKLKKIATELEAIQPAISYIEYPTKAKVKVNLELIRTVSVVIMIFIQLAILGHQMGLL